MGYYKNLLIDTPKSLTAREESPQLPVSGRFDVFLAHNSEDKVIVESVAISLLGRGLTPWFDKWDLPPGRLFQDEIEGALASIHAVAVFVGPSGIGPWEHLELRAAISEFARRKLPVIPVILPGTKRTPDLPLFLREFGWVRFVGAPEDDDEAIDRLVFGVTGVNPAPQNPTARGE